MMKVASSHLTSRNRPYELEMDVGYPGAPKKASSNGSKTIRRLLNAYDRDPIFSDWASSSTMKNIIGQIINSSKFMLSKSHHNCIMTKQPNFSSLTGWHRDIRYWDFDKPELVTAWLALGSESYSNGSLSLIPQSHKINFHPRVFDEKDFFKAKLKSNEELLRKKVSVSLRTGDLLIFHCKLLHSAGRNSSDVTKYSVVFTYHHPDNKPISGSRSAQQKSIELL